ncbi:hypothetical protein Agub_g8596, partial [Astrephomene gubernaculifera]
GKGGAAGRKGGGKGGGGGGKDRPSSSSTAAAAAATASEVAAAAAGGPLDVREQLEWLSSCLGRGPGEPLRAQVVEAAMGQLGLVGQPEEGCLKELLREYAPALGEALLMRLVDDTQLAPKLLHIGDDPARAALFSEFLRRTRLGEQLVAGEPREAEGPGFLPESERFTRRVAQFCSGLAGLPVLRRFEVVEALGQRFVTLARMEISEAGASELLPPHFELPGSPTEVLESSYEPSA